MSCQIKPLLKIFKALSDANRLRILKMLEIRPLCVCEITEVLQLANSTVSKHLSILKECDLILDEKDGKWVNYSLNELETDKIEKQLLSFLQILDHDEVIQSDAKKVQATDRNQICGV